MQSLTSVRFRFSLICVVFSLVFHFQNVNAALFPEGSKYVCVGNPMGNDSAVPTIATDFVSLYFEDARIPKQAGLFTSDKALGFAFKIFLTYRTPNDVNEGHTITGTKVYKFD